MDAISNRFWKKHDVFLPCYAPYRLQSKLSGKKHLATFFILIPCDKDTYLDFWVTRLISNLKKNYCHYNLHLTVSFLASTGKILQGEFTTTNFTKSIHLLWQHSQGSMFALLRYSFCFSLCLWSYLWESYNWVNRQEGLWKNSLHDREASHVLPAVKRFRHHISKYKQSCMTKIEIIK